MVALQASMESCCNHYKIYSCLRLFHKGYSAIQLKFQIGAVCLVQCSTATQLGQ